MTHSIPITQQCCLPVSSSQYKSTNPYRLDTCLRLDNDDNISHQTNPTNLEPELVTNNSGCYVADNNNCSSQRTFTIRNRSKSPSSFPPISSSSTQASNLHNSSHYQKSSLLSTPLTPPPLPPPSMPSSGQHSHHSHHHHSHHHRHNHQQSHSPPAQPHTQCNYCKLFFKLSIVLISFAGFLYQATDICAHYFSYRTVVYTNTEQDALVDLPSITFCLPTYFTKRTLEELYAPYIRRNVEETAAFKNRSMLDAIKPVIYETFQKQAFKDLTAAEILDRSISDDGIIECRLFYPPQHWPNLTRERMYEIVQYGLPCEEVTQVIPSINANGKCFTFFSQLLTDSDSLKAYQQQQQQSSNEPQVEYQQYPQMTSFATSSASSASTRSTGPVAPPVMQQSRYMPVSHKIAVNHGYRFHSGRFIRLQVQFNRDQYTVISDGHQRECIQVHPPFKIPSEACLHSINPGMSYDFVLTKTKAILQPPPYQTNCQSYQAVTPAESELLASASDPSDLKEFYLKPMSRSDCIDKCMIHIYEKYCGCLPIHISIWQRSSLFLNMSVCDYEDFERISPCLEKELSSTCYDTCKSDCIDRHYHLHVESRVYPSDEQIRLANGVERNRLMRLQQSAATISIWSNYLSDITYVHTPAMSLIQLICYLGGLAGLWLGVSVMTVSGWLAQLYPFMQKFNYKQQYIMLTCRRNLKYIFNRIRSISTGGSSSLSSVNGKCSPIDYDKSDCCYVRQTFLPSESSLESETGPNCCSSYSRSSGVGSYDEFCGGGGNLVDHHSGPLSGNIIGTTTTASRANRNRLLIGKVLKSKSVGLFDSTDFDDAHMPDSLIMMTDESKVSSQTATTNIGDNISGTGAGSAATLPATATGFSATSAAAAITTTNYSNPLGNSSAGQTNATQQYQHAIHHPFISGAGRRSVYWSNYSSMSTSSDDVSLISSSTSSTVTNASNCSVPIGSTNIGSSNNSSSSIINNSGFGMNGGNSRRMSICNSMFNSKLNLTKTGSNSSFKAV